MKMSILKKSMALYLVMTILMSCFAGVALAAQETEVITYASKEIKWDGKYEVVIIGAGGAGLAAACSAGEAGAKTLVIEEEATETRNNTAYSSGVYMAAETSLQAELGIQDSKAEFKKFVDCMSEGLADEKMMEIWIEEGGPVFDWLYKEVGVPFTKIQNLDQTPFYGHVTPPVARGHLGDTKSGMSLVRGMYDYAAERGVEFLFNTRATKLITNGEGRVIGVETDGGNFRASRGVIIATGGFSKNKWMMQAFQPNVQASSTVTPQRGDGIVMAWSLGAKLGNMWCPQVDLLGLRINENVVYDPHVASLTQNMFMVAQDGKRHFREDLYYEQLSWNVGDQEGGYVWSVWDQVETDSGESSKPAFSAGCEEEIALGAVVKADTIEELGVKMGMSGEALDNLVNTYNNWVSYCETGVDPEFGREKNFRKPEAPFYAAKIIQSILDTNGGLVTVPETTEVLNVWDETIPGLFAAGNAVSGYRGKMYTGGGSAISTVIVFGRRAGAYVAQNVPDANAGEYFSAEGVVGVRAQNEVFDESRSTGVMKDGTYVGVGYGQGGQINVTIEVKDGVFTITDISPNNETVGFGGYEAIEDGTYKAMFEEAQSVIVDNISGATVTTEAMKSAVLGAINQSRF